MYRFLLKPRWIAFTLLCVVAVVTMVNLSLWQLRRLHEREAFNELVRTNADQDVAPIADVLTPGADPDDIEWRRVSVTGTYLADQQVIEVNRSQDGEAGFNVIDGLRPDDGDGTVLIVNRGFVPGTEPAPPAPDGTVTIIGQLRRTETRTLGAPSDASGVVLTEVNRIDAPKISAHLGGDVEPMYVQLLTSTPAEGRYPANVAPPVLDDGPHLSYTIQWLIFSLCVIVGWVFAVRRSANTRAGRPRKRRGPPPIADELSRVGTGSSPPAAQ
jgi:cytochrome oxidase assembly protein ShyY1